jgi:membrane associated rhomboid family serine protease
MFLARLAPRSAALPAALALARASRRPPPPPLQPRRAASTLAGAFRELAQRIRGGAGPWPVLLLIAANVAVCGVYLTQAPQSEAARRWFGRNMVLSSSRFRRRPLVLATHAFMHIEPLHCGLNMYTLWSFGGATCAMLGVPRFLALYGAAGLAGGAAQLAYNRLMPRLQLPASRFVRADDAIVGASAAIAGVVFYNIVRVPHGEVIIFILPVPNPVFAAAFIAGSAYLATMHEGRSHYAHAGHLGGALTGVAYALFRRARRA